MEAHSSPRSSLEYGTKLVGRHEGFWGFRLYPDAAEGGGSFRSAAGQSSRGDGRYLSDLQANEADAARRARGKVRRYCTANGLNRLGTLTYRGDGCHEPERLRADLGSFFRRLRVSVGQSFPYLWVPEWHKQGHGLHAHFAVGRFIRRGAIEAAWGRGFVHIKHLGDLPVGSGTRGEARAAAGYLSKYLGKDLGVPHPTGLHRYEVAQGFQPRSVALDGPTSASVLTWAEGVMGAAPHYVWRSREQEHWDGPPAVWAQWA
jgi:hypothetical protein